MIYLFVCLLFLPQFRPWHTTLYFTFSALTPNHSVCTTWSYKAIQLSSVWLLPLLGARKRSPADRGWVIYYRPSRALNQYKYFFLDLSTLSLTPETHERQTSLWSAYVSISFLLLISLSLESSWAGEDQGLDDEKDVGEKQRFESWRWLTHKGRM